MVLEFHFAHGCAKAQSGQRIHNHPQALNPLEFIAPSRRQVAVHLSNKCLPVGALQNGLHLFGQREGLRHVPLRQHPRVDHQHAFFMHRQVLHTQPVHQGVAIRGLQNILNRVPTFEGLNAKVYGQQMQIMVAKQAPRTAAQVVQASQNTKVVWPAVDQVAQQEYGVAAWRKANLFQPLRQCAVAALYVANQVKCHGMIVIDSFEPHPCGFLTA